MPLSKQAPEGVVDKDGNKVLGYNELDQPIIGTDKNNEPIIGNVGKEADAIKEEEQTPHLGYTNDGVPILNFAKEVPKPKLGKPTGLKDKRGKDILGFNDDNEPIIGKESNGKDKIGDVGKEPDGTSHLGYKADGLPVLGFEKDKIEPKLVPPTLQDKNGSPILDYNEDGLPIIAKDYKGKAKLGEVDKEPDGTPHLGYTPDGVPVLGFEK